MNWAGAGLLKHRSEANYCGEPLEQEIRLQTVKERAFRKEPSAEEEPKRDERLKPREG